MKSHTDIEQSKKLAEILPIESADMFYRDNGIDAKLMWEHNAHKVKYPCWSLTALLDVVQEPELIRNSEGTWLIRVWYNRYPFSRGGYNNPVDACYEMILKLHELKIL